MQITEVTITPISNEKKLKGFASIVFDDCFVVSDIKIIETPKSAFLSMPSKKSGSGRFRDVAHPLNAETRRMIEDRVFEEYEKVTGYRISRDGSGEVEPEMPAEAAASPAESFETAAEPEEKQIEPSDLLSVKEFGY